MEVMQNYINVIGIMDIFIHQQKIINIFLSMQKDVHHVINKFVIFVQKYHMPKMKMILVEY